MFARAFAYLKNHFPKSRFSFAVLIAASVGLVWLGIGTLNLRDILFKILLVAVAHLLASFGRRGMFPWMDLTAIATGTKGWDSQPEFVRAGALIFGGLYHAAVIVGVLLGT